MKCWYCKEEQSYSEDWTYLCDVIISKNGKPRRFKWCICATCAEDVFPKLNVTECSLRCGNFVTERHKMTFEFCCKTCEKKYYKAERDAAFWEQKARQILKETPSK